VKGEIRQKRTLGDDGEWVLTPEYVLDGKAVSEAEYNAALPSGTGEGVMFADSITNAKPLRSDALAIHSKQREAIMARNAKHGINIHYDRAGRPVFTDKGQRKALMKLEKVRSMNSFDGY
jgi:uncharacterized FAD-dependent dehydrogenase